MNVPELRFPEFSDEWEDKAFGNICQIKKSKYNPENEKENLKCIELEHLSQNTGKILDYCNSKGQNSIKNRFEKGNVLFGKLRPYLRKYWLAKFDGVCSSEIWVFDGKEISNDFLFQLIQTNKFNYISNISSGSKMPRSDWKYMKHVKFKIPSLKEQEKIASFLSKLDEKIEKLEKKQELWETYKKGMLQKIFSQELRFKDENGEDYPDWEEKSMISIGKFFKGSNLSKNDLVDSGFPCVLYGDLFTVYDEVIFDVKKFIKNRNEKLVIGKKGDILLPSSTTVDAWSIACSSTLMVENVALGGDLNVWRPQLDLINSIFISYQINQSVKKDIAKLAQGTTIVHLYNHQLKNVTLKIPNIEEQEKIANIMVSIDYKIKKINLKVEIYKEFKKGLLQKMFF